MKKLFLFLSLLFFVVVSCEKADQKPISVPSATISCTSSSCTGHSGPYTATVIYTRSGCGADQSGFDDVATGSVTVSCGVSGCTGTVSSWFKDSITVTEILSGTYDICGHIDFNNDTVQNSGDGKHDMRVTLSEGGSIVMSSWTSY